MNEYLKFITKMAIEDGEILLYPITSKDVYSKLNKEYEPTQNDRELKLLRVIFANVFGIETTDPQSTELRAFALGRLEAMIEYKQIKNETN